MRFENDLSRLGAEACPALEAAQLVDRWGTLASGGVEVLKAPGDHFTMLRQPHVEVLGRELRRRLCKETSPREAGKAMITP